MSFQENPERAGSRSPGPNKEPVSFLEKTTLPKERWKMFEKKTVRDQMKLRRGGIEGSQAIPSKGRSSNRSNGS